MNAKKPIKIKNKNGIVKTREILTKIEQSNIKKQLYSNGFTIGDMNLLSKKLNKNPELVKTIKESINKKTFNFKKFMTEIKK
jgi:hypothetical protein